MANRKGTNRPVEKARLVLEKEQFLSQLSERIEIGKKLPLIKASVPNIPDAYREYGYMTRKARTEPTEEQEKWISEFKQWTDYNSELLKQAFDIPNNEYQRDYINSGQYLISIGNENLVQEYQDELKSKIEYLETLVLKIPLLPTLTVQVERTEKKSFHPDSKRVFIVHGHDTAIRSQVELFIKTLGYTPVVLFKQPNAGCTIIEKIEREANDLAFAIILYTACDLGNDKLHANEHLNPRAQQNVVFEHGYMCALLGRQNVCALVDSDVEFPGDMSGIVYVSFDDKGAWQIAVAKEMKAAGLDVDLNKLA